MYSLKIIIGSTRPGSRGKIIGSWVAEKAKQIPEVQVELLDLAVINLPFLDEPAHPRLRKYQHEHTKDWSNTIASADALIVVTAEYNYGFPAPLKNAIDYLHHEWAYKPVGLVSYGGVAAGTRAVQMLKLVLTALRMVPVVESVNIPYFAKYFDGNDRFNPDDSLQKSADAMLAELLHWTSTLRGMRS